MLSIAKKGIRKCRTTSDNKAKRKIRCQTLKKLDGKPLVKLALLLRVAQKAVAAGIEILEAGGNAADAAAGTILALNVTDHGACSIGGEVPLLIFDAGKQEVKSLSGQGRAPLSQDRN